VKHKIGLASIGIAATMVDNSEQFQVLMRMLWRNNAWSHRPVT